MLSHCIASGASQQVQEKMRTFLSRFSCCGQEEEKPSEGKKLGTWRIFSLRELHAATNNFNYDNKLGEGGFGSVYWGQLASGDQNHQNEVLEGRRLRSELKQTFYEKERKTTLGIKLPKIAVKRLKVWSTKAEMEFAVEVEILGRVRHKNLLVLRGYCAEGQERLIVYDYMPKLSLLTHLHGQFAADSTLDWKRRMKIATGSAEALAYLHHYATPHIVHRDIKASNVLLDENFEAQVADFGFAKLIPDGATHVTTRVKGTLGYLAPEYAMWGKVSESCDVYSFGILLLELISGKKPIERVAGAASKRTIVEWAGPLVLHGNYCDLVDPRLQGNFEENELIRVVQVAALCAQSAPEMRPTMQDVVEMLKDANNGLLKLYPENGTDGLHLEPVKYDPAMLAADDGSVHGTKRVLNSPLRG